MGEKPTLDDVFKIFEGDDCIEDGTYCMSCGEDFTVGEKAVYVPAGFGPENMILMVHLHCAVKQDEIEMVGTVVA